MTPDEAKKKMKNLRSSYLTEKKKVEDAKKSGAATGDLYVPNLFYYDEMKFLDEAIVLRSSSTNCNRKKTQELDESVLSGPTEEYTNDDAENIQEAIEVTENLFKSFLNTSEKETNSLHEKCEKIPIVCEKRNKKRKTALENISLKYDNAIERLCNFSQQNQEEDVFSAFTKSITLQLKQLPARSSTAAMAEIQSILSKHTLAILPVPCGKNNNDIRIISNRIVRPSSQMSSTSTTSNNSTTGTPLRTSAPSLSSSCEIKNIFDAAMINAGIFCGEDDDY